MISYEPVIQTADANCQYTVACSTTGMTVTVSSINQYKNNDE